MIAGSAAAAGLVVHIPTIDANKNDVRIETWGAWEGKARQIGLQLKATASPSFVGPADNRRLAFSLDAPTYNALREDGSIQRFLVVVAVPEQDHCWVRQRSSVVGLHAGAWWVQITGEETNQGSKTVYLPVEQRFDLAGLEAMLRLA